MDDRDKPYGGYLIYGTPELEGRIFRFWLHPNPLVTTVGPFVAFAWENNYMGWRYDFVSTGDMIVALARIKRWFGLPSVSFDMNRSRLIGTWTPRLRFQCNGYVDTYEV